MAKNYRVFVNNVNHTFFMIAPMGVIRNALSLHREGEARIIREVSANGFAEIYCNRGLFKNCSYLIYESNVDVLELDKN